MDSQGFVGICQELLGFIGVLKDSRDSLVFDGIHKKSLVFDCV